MYVALYAEVYLTLTSFGCDRLVVFTAVNTISCISLLTNDDVGCRYMVVLKMGGVYADIDTECKQPLDAIIRSKDTLIVGWENEFADAEKAAAAW